VRFSPRGATILTGVFSRFPSHYRQLLKRNLKISHGRFLPGLSFTIIFQFKTTDHIFSCQRLNPATSSPANYVHHYIIPQKLLDSIFNKLPVFMRQWEKEKAVLYPVEVPPLYQTTFMLPQLQGNTAC
jgi:hypothetical protein